MKYLIIILLAFITLGVQAQKKDRIVNNKITPDSISTQIVRLDTLKFNDGTSMSTASIGSTITASDGVYMDGDTVKLGRELLLNESLSDHFGINNDGIGGYMNVEGFPGGGSWLGYYDNQTNYHLQIDQFGVGINSYGALVNLNLRIDTTGIHYITSPDTTLTTPTHLMTEAQTKREINAMQPTNNIFSWDAVNKWYAPYSSKQASMSFYTGTTNPTLTDRLNLDGKLYSSGFSVTTGSTNTVGFQCTTNTGSAYGVYVNNNVGDGIYVLNSSSSSGIKIDNGSNVGLLVNNNSNGEGIKIQYSGSNRVSNFLNLTKSQSGTQDADGHFIKITDNSTTSGTISGKVLSVIIGLAERISLNPRATETTTPYIFQAHNKPTGNLFEFGMQGRNKVYADTSGNLTHKAIGAEIYRGRLSGDTTQSIPTGTTPTKVTAFASNGQSSICTADKDNDQLILNKIGWYDAELSISYNSGTANVEWVAYIFGNGTEMPSIGSTGKAVTSGDGRSTQLGGRFYVDSVPYYVDYRVTHNNGSSVNVTFSRLNLRVTYQGY